VVLAGDTTEVVGLARLLMEHTGIDSVVTYVDFYQAGNLEWAENIGRLNKEAYILSSYLDDHEVQRKEFTDFVRRHYKKYQRGPNHWTVTGYDQAMLVARAIAQGGSCLPRDIIGAMRGLDYDGIAQDYRFTRMGELKHPDIGVLKSDELYGIAQNLGRYARDHGLETETTTDGTR
jgi:hypothetical protein